MKSYVTLQEWHFCFHQFCGVPAVKPFWPSKPNVLGAPPPDGQTPSLGNLTWHSEFSQTEAHQAPLSMGILQERTQVWIAMPTSKGSS